MPKAEKSQLHQALDHVYIASTGTANFAPYCHFQPGWLVGYDGLIAAGMRVNDNLQVAPQTDTFRHAVGRANGPYSITVKLDNTIVVTGHKLRAVVPCFPNTAIPNVVADSPLGPCGEAIRGAILAAGKIVAVKSDTVIGSAIELRSNSAVATDGMTILEAWHGGELPLKIILPKEFAEAIRKVKAPATHFGFSDETFTMWFGQERWIRTNLYGTEYPDTDTRFARVMASVGEFRPVPTELLQAIETIKPFREGWQTALRPYGINTKDDDTGAYYQFEHYMQYAGNFPTNALEAMATYGEHVAFGGIGAYWYGSVVRGITALGA